MEFVRFSASEKYIFFRLNFSIFRRTGLDRYLLLCFLGKLAAIILCKHHRRGNFIKIASVRAREGISVKDDNRNCVSDSSGIYFQNAGSASSSSTV